MDSRAEVQEKLRSASPLEEKTSSASSAAAFTSFSISSILSRADSGHAATAKGHAAKLSGLLPAPLPLSPHHQTHLHDPAMLSRLVVFYFVYFFIYANISTFISSFII